MRERVRECPSGELRRLLEKCSRDTLFGDEFGAAPADRTDGAEGAAPALPSAFAQRGESGWTTRKRARLGAARDARLSSTACACTTDDALDLVEELEDHADLHS